jgi:hypothetical protein
LVRFESISPSFERNDTTTKSRAHGREHMPTCQLWRVLMSRVPRILKRHWFAVFLPRGRVGADRPHKAARLVPKPPLTRNGGSSYSEERGMEIL